MKTISLIILLLINYSAQAASFIKVVTHDNQVISGELIETYIDRWFYEPPLKDVQKYVLIFKIIDDSPHFFFKNFNEIKHFSPLGKSDSLYKKYLIDNDILFKNTLVEDAHILTGNEGHHKYEKMYGNFAWDIGKIDENGSQYKANGLKLDDYYIFDSEVTSPLSGTVVGKINNQEDNKPDLTFTASLENKENNFLTLHIQKMFYLSIVHFKKKSITVDIGDKVEVGQLLGKVGNSGVSYIPHLHYTMYIYIAEKNRFISVPGFFE